MPGKRIDLEKVYEMRGKGMTYRTIADRLKISEGGIYHRLHKIGIKRSRPPNKIEFPCIHSYNYHDLCEKPRTEPKRERRLWVLKKEIESQRETNAKLSKEIECLNASLKNVSQENIRLQKAVEERRGGGAYLEASNLREANKKLRQELDETQKNFVSLAGLHGNYKLEKSESENTRLHSNGSALLAMNENLIKIILKILEG